MSTARVRLDLEEEAARKAAKSIQLSTIAKAAVACVPAGLWAARAH